MAWRGQWKRGKRREIGRGRSNVVPSESSAKFCNSVSSTQLPDATLCPLRHASRTACLVAVSQSRCCSGVVSSRASSRRTRALRQLQRCQWSLESEWPAAVATARVSQFESRTDHRELNTHGVSQMKKMCDICWFDNRRVRNVAEEGGDLAGGPAPDGRSLAKPFGLH